MNISNKILNIALHLSMEFGENWLVEINDRLSAKHPELNKNEIDYCAKISKQINKNAHEYIRKNPVKNDHQIEFVAFSIFEKFMTDKYEWINENNLKSLYSQSCYYALK